MRRLLNRSDAGQQLAERLLKHADRPDVIVLAVPSGGVPVAYEIVQIKKAPLDLLIVRKLGMPGAEELAIGAIASGGKRILHEEVIRTQGVNQMMIERVIVQETAETREYEQNNSCL